MTDNLIDCKKLSFQECEELILKMQVKEAKNKIGKRTLNSTEIQQMLYIIESFLKKKKVICYGGTAINNILPESVHFYNRKVDLADYDFFSTDGVNDAKELADLYAANGFHEVEAKAAQHHGTFKVFVNFIPIADISTISKTIFVLLMDHAIEKDNIYYAPPNFLRMSIYTELSRPAGDTDRWEKIVKRLQLLNKYYPITKIHCEEKFRMNNNNNNNSPATTDYIINGKFNPVLDTLISLKVVFFGGFAVSQYANFMRTNVANILSKTISGYDVLAKNPEHVSNVLLRTFDNKDGKVTRLKHKSIGDIIPESYEIKFDSETICFIYKTIACHSYNIIELYGKRIKIASIFTMLSFYLAFLYIDKSIYKSLTEKMFCLAHFLFELQQEHATEQSGILKMYTISCYGHQQTTQEMRKEKAKKKNKLKKGTKEYDEWFLHYRPPQKQFFILKSTTSSTSSSLSSASSASTKKPKTIKKKTQPNKKKKKNKTRKGAKKWLWN